MRRCVLIWLEHFVQCMVELAKFNQEGQMNTYLSTFLLQLSGLQKYEELLTRINAEVAQRLLNIMPTVS